MCDPQEFPLIRRFAACQKEPVAEAPNRVVRNPLVSVCVQTYQHAPFIRQCLEGILMQRSDFPFEVLLADDESSDGTRETCEQIAREHPEQVRLFRHHRQNNISISGRPSGRFCFIHNLLHARGAFLAMCEGDDYWLDPHKLQKQVEAMRRHPGCALCFHAAREVYADGSLPERVICEYAEGERVFGLQEMVLGGGGFAPSASLLVRRGIVDDLPPWFIDVPVGDTFFQIYGCKSGGALFIPGVMAVYRRFVSGSWSERIEKNRQPEALLKGYVEFYSLMKADFPEQSRLIEYRIAYYAKQLARQRNERQAGSSSRP